MRLIKTPPSDSLSPAQASIIIHQFVMIVDGPIFWQLSLHIGNLAAATIKFVDFCFRIIAKLDHFHSILQQVKTLSQIHN